MNDLFLNFPFYLFFAVLPSFIWLNYYLKKDERPEPKLMVLQVFLLGMLITLPAVFLERFAVGILTEMNFSTFWRVFLGVALVEEFLKFLVVRQKVFKSREFDEPVDAMIYMIIAGLGFAGAENLFFLFSFAPPPPINSFFQFNWLVPVFEISFWRFAGATLLHALSSAFLGFYIGLSFFRAKERTKLIFFGLFAASLLHGFYNFFIIELGEKVGIFLAGILLIFSAIFIAKGFKKLRNKKWQIFLKN